MLWISINDSTLASVCYTVIYMVRVGLELGTWWLLGLALKKAMVGTWWTIPHPDCMDRLRKHYSHLAEG